MNKLELTRLLQLDDGPRRVLIVEDAAEHYDAMIAWLQRENHAVAAFGEIHDLADGLLTGRTLYDDPAAVQVATLDVAFLDFYFPRTPWNGGRLARALISENPQIRIFGMSSVASKNTEMMREGALHGLLKRDLGRLITD